MQPAAVHAAPCAEYHHELQGNRTTGHRTVAEELQLFGRHQNERRRSEKTDRGQSLEQNRRRSREPDLRLAERRLLGRRAQHPRKEQRTRERRRRAESPADHRAGYRYGRLRHADPRRCGLQPANPAGHRLRRPGTVHPASAGQQPNHRLVPGIRRPQRRGQQQDPGQRLADRKGVGHRRNRGHRLRNAEEERRHGRRGADQHGEDGRQAVDLAGRLPARFGRGPQHPAERLDQRPDLVRNPRPNLARNHDLAAAGR